MKKKSRKGQVSKKVSGIVALGLLVLIVVSVISIINITQSIVIRDSKDLLATKASDNSIILDDWLSEQGEIVETMMATVVSLNTDDHNVIMDYLETQLSQNEAALMYYVCLGDEKAVLPADHSNVDLDPTSRGWWTQAWEKNGLVYVDPYIDHVTGGTVISIAVPCRIKGQDAVVLADITIDTLLEKISAIETDESTKAFLLTTDNKVITHSNLEFLPKDGEFITLTDKVDIDLDTEEITTFEDYDGLNRYSCIRTVESTQWKLGVCMDLFLVQNYVMSSLKTSVIILIILGTIINILVYTVISRLLAPVSKVCDSIVSLSEGDFTTYMSPTKRKDEIGVLQNKVYELEETLSGIIGDTNHILEQITSNNLTVADMKAYPGEFNALSNSVNQIKYIMAHLLKEMQMAAYGVEDGSNQLAGAAESLSEGTTSQASSIMTLESQMNDTVESIHRNADNCVRVNGELSDLDIRIQEGNLEMEKLRSAVDEVAKMSTDIQQIVGAIDNIAFQTNILALNASVEAARAGDNGKGFAVVAEEVRNLAARSADEAGKTSELIKACLDSIDVAKMHAESTAECLSSVAGSSTEISHAFDTISSDTEDQARRSDSIQEEIHNISDVVQSNIAAAEETAASSQQLSDQALRLNDMVKKFQV